MFERMTLYPVCDEAEGEALYWGFERARYVPDYTTFHLLAALTAHKSVLQVLQASNEWFYFFKNRQTGHFALIVWCGRLI